VSVEDLYKRATEAIERPNYDYAVRLLRDVLRRDPAYPDARMLLRATERRRAEAKGRSPLGLLAAPPAMAFTAVRALLRKPQDRLDVYEDYLERRPSSFWGLMGAAGAAADAGLTEQAAMLYRDALHLRPRSKKALRSISNLLVALGQTQEALKHLSSLAAMEPTDRDLQTELRNVEAQDHMSAHRMQQAEGFRDLIRDRDEAARLEESRRMAVTMDDLAREAARLEEELVDQPDSLNRVLRLAQLYQDTGRLDDAAGLLKQKREFFPDNYAIREKDGDVRLALYDRAIEEAQTRLRESPRDSALAAKLNRLRKAKRDYGIQEYKWRLAEHPTDRAIPLQLGYLYMQAGDHNQAIAAFQSAAQDARYAERSLKPLGQCFMAKGQHDLALDQFQHAIELHPDMDAEGKELRYCAAQAYEAMGNPQGALRMYKGIYSQDITFRDVASKVDALSG
jgi:tetratricopeptide (TPR) repeat protein